MPNMSSPSTMFFKFFFAHENMKNPASNVAKPAQIQPKSQFLFYKNLPPHDFSIMTLNILYLLGNRDKGHAPGRTAKLLGSVTRPSRPFFIAKNQAKQAK